MKSLASITAAMCGAGRSLASPRQTPDGVAYVVMGDGRPRVARVPAAGGAEVVLTSDPACMGCHPHGGGVFDLSRDGRLLAYVGIDGLLYVADLRGGPGLRVYGDPGTGEELASPSFSPSGDAIAFTVDDRRVMRVDLREGGRASAITVSGGTGAQGGDPDFVLDPVWHPDGQSLAWVEWDVPNMPWDASRIVQAPSEGFGKPELLAGDGETAVSQPRWSPDGSRLAYISDATGWPVVWLAAADGSSPSPYREMRYEEHAEPTWGPGQKSFSFSPDSSEIVVAINRGGRWSLQLGSRSLTGMALGLDWGAAGITAVLSSPGHPSSVVVIDPGDLSVCRVLARGPVGGFERAEPYEVSDLVWPVTETDGVEVKGRIFRAPDLRDEPPFSGGLSARGGKSSRSSRAGRPSKGPERLLVWIHGGPTGQMTTEFNARLAFFLEKGWTVMAPDFRGSSGWGRAYRQALRGKWGDRGWEPGGWGHLDVEDVAAGIAEMHRLGIADPSRTALMGASSGGMCVLLVMARHPGLVAAGVDLYGVTDLADLSEHTHRFESHYADGLIGPLPDHAELYRERSPLRCAAAIRDPLLVLHGDSDKVVPLEQSARLVGVIEAAGGRVDFHVYEGEGHGWSDPSTVTDELVRIVGFLDRHVPAGAG